MARIKPLAALSLWRSVGFGGSSLSVMAHLRSDFLTHQSEWSEPTFHTRGECGSNPPGGTEFVDR
jgi:hypothetical protein